MGAKGLVIEWKLFVKQNPGFAKNKDFKPALVAMSNFAKYGKVWAKAESAATKYAPQAEASWDRMIEAMEAFEKKAPPASKAAFEAFLKQCKDMDGTMKKAFDARKDYDPIAKAARTKSAAEEG